MKDLMHFSPIRTGGTFCDMRTSPTHPALRAPLFIEGNFVGAGLGPLYQEGWRESAGVCRFDAEPR